MYPELRAITVCVDYCDLLRMTLPTTMTWASEVVVVTSPRDIETIDYITMNYGASVRLYVTDAFYRNGAIFNKGLALEEGFDALGREGWIVVMDSDILTPGDIRPYFPSLQEGKLYGLPRRILADPREYREGMDWSRLPLRKDLGLYGYFQLFHADDPVLVRQPWYGIDWTHAGGCDKDFQDKWHPSNKIRPASPELLHLGNPDENWFGRTTRKLSGEVPAESNTRRALQEKLKRKHGWSRRKTGEAFEEKIQ